MDWKDIKALTEAEALSIVSTYLEKHGYSISKLDETKFPQGVNVPDLEVSQKEKVFAYCEVKAPKHIFNEETGLYMWNTTFNKLRSFTRKASKQLVAIDEAHEKVRVLAFTSNHPQLNWTSFINRLNNAVIFNGKIIRDFKSKNELRILDDDLMEIDIIVWFQVNYINRDKIVQLVQFVNKDSPIIGKVSQMSDAITPTQEENIKGR